MVVLTLVIARRRRLRALGPAIDAIDVVETSVNKQLLSGSQNAGVGVAEGFQLVVRPALKRGVTRTVRFKYAFSLEDSEGVRLGMTAPKRATLKSDGPTDLTLSCGFAPNQPGGYRIRFWIDGQQAAERHVQR